MSYLQIVAGVPDFSKTVISLWFRVPKVSMMAAAAQPYPQGRLPILHRCIPLLTFGRPQQETELIPNWVNLCGPLVAPPGDPGPRCLSIVSYNAGQKFDLDPCYIALDCTDAASPVLAFNLQTQNFASGTLVDGINDAAATSPQPTSQEQINEWAALAKVRGSGWLDQRGTASGFVYRHFVNATGILNLSHNLLEAAPELFYVKTVHPITPDRWHHLLLSFDISIPVVTYGPPPTNDHHGTDWDNVSQGTSSFAKMWYAIDDVDYRGRTAEDEYHLGPYSVDHDSNRSSSPGSKGGDPNGILTKAGWEVPFYGTSGTTRGNQIMPVPAYQFGEGELPSHDANFGLPASTAYVENIYRVEMAELQMWTGIVLDTGIVKNRRGFVDAGGKPVPPAEAEKLLGRKPEVMLHYSSKWKEGLNTGTRGMNIDETVLPAGQFKRTGGIEAYKPEPQLGV